MTVKSNRSEKKGTGIFSRGPAMDEPRDSTRPAIIVVPLDGHESTNTFVLVASIDL